MSYRPADNQNEDTANTLSPSWSHWAEWPSLQQAPAPTACPPVDRSQIKGQCTCSWSTSKRSYSYSYYWRKEKYIFSYLCNLDSRQRLSISLGQVQFILLDVQLFHLVRCIHRNNVLKRCENEKKVLKKESAQALFCLRSVTVQVSIHVAILPLSGQKREDDMVL